MNVEHRKTISGNAHSSTVKFTNIIAINEALADL